MERRHPNEISPTAPLSEQATAWWMLLNEGQPTSADQHAFGEWVARSPERVAAYLGAARLTRVLTSRSTQWPETPTADLIRAARTSVSEVASLPSAGAAGAAPANRSASLSKLAVPWLTRPRVAALVLTAVAAVTVGLFYIHLSPQRVETALGEQRSVVLSDGSLVTLNTASSIEVRMASDRRTVKLLAGEALFSVAHDASRPFEVTTDNTTVRAIGTQFNVDRHRTTTTVTVVEGRVAVITTGDRNHSTQLSPVAAGEQLTLAPQNVQHSVHTDVATAIAWTQRKLVFEHRHLDEVAEEFNRYNRQIIEIRGAALRGQEVTGVFQANDPASFLTFLAGLPGVSIERSADRVVVTQQVSVTAQ